MWLQRMNYCFKRHPVAAGFWIIFLIHLVIALSLKWGAGIDIESDTGKNNWDYFWQTIPLADLQSNFWLSLWNLHAQPPLFNVYGAILNRIFGENFLQAMQYVNILLGAVMCGLVYPIVLHLTGRVKLSLFAALMFSVNPSIFLYEAFILYSNQVAFLVVVMVFMMVRFCQTTQRRWFYGVMAGLSVLILYRSLYHLALIIPVIGIGLELVQKQRLRLVLVSLLISLPAVGWYAKNQAVFGFFGSSSWMGSNMWRMVSENYSEAELKDLADRGVIDRVAYGIKYFDRPSVFARYGYTKTSDVPMLARDDYHNINMLDISRMHVENAKRLIRHDPGHYGMNAAKAYQRFCRPSYETKFVSTNTARIPGIISFSTFLHGGGTVSWYLFLIPLIFVGFLRRMWKGGLPWVCCHGVEALILVLVGYVTLVGSLMEYGENCRFKFGVEMLILAMALWLLFPRRSAHFGAE